MATDIQQPRHPFAFLKHLVAWLGIETTAALLGYPLRGNFTGTSNFLKVALDIGQLIVAGQRKLAREPLNRIATLQVGGKRTELVQPPSSSFPASQR